jgi:putative endonuclease
MFYVYCLYSESYDKIYVGFTRDIANRMEWHNEKSKKGFTTKYRPWRVVYTEEYATEQEAREREKYLKSYRGRMFLRTKIQSSGGESGS